MSSLRRALRLPLAAAAIVLIAFTTGCSNSTGPDTGARQGYITSSNAVNRGFNVPAGVPAVPSTTVKTDSSSTTNSGYNVTAF